MDGAGDFLGAQHGDRPLDLPPAAEMDHVSERAAAICALRRLELGELAIMGNEISGLDQGLTILDMNMIVHAYTALSRSLVDDCLALRCFRIGALPS